MFPFIEIVLSVHDFLTFSTFGSGSIRSAAALCFSVPGNIIRSTKATIAPTRSQSVIYTCKHIAWISCILSGRLWQRCDTRVLYIKSPVTVHAAKFHVSILTAFFAQTSHWNKRRVRCMHGNNGYKDGVVMEIQINNKQLKKYERWWWNIKLPTKLSTDAQLSAAPVTMTMLLDILLTWRSLGNITIQQSAFHSRRFKNMPSFHLRRSLARPIWVFPIPYFSRLALPDIVRRAVVLAGNLYPKAKTFWAGINESRYKYVSDCHRQYSRITVPWQKGAWLGVSYT